MVFTTRKPQPHASRGLLVRVLPFVLVVPLVAIPTVTVLVWSGGSQGGRLPVAQGASGGAFHPVAGGFEPDETRLEECAGRYSCLEQAFGNIAFREGPRAALALFDERMSADPDVEKNCHRIAHAIGSASLERFDGDVARAFSHGSPSCVSGYYHGILDLAFLGVSSQSGLVRVARSLCAGEGIRRFGFLDYQCRHGLGHGLMIQTGYDLPLTLSICAGLDTGWDRRACASGAFMENVDTRFGVRSPWLDDADPLYPCATVRAADRRSCYLRASWRILTLNGGDFERTAAACADLGVWSETCFQGYGRDAAEKARYSPSDIGPLCRLAAGGEGDCLLGAARTIANAWGRAGIARARPLCDRAPSGLQESCFAGIGLVVGMLHPTDTARAAACARVTPEHRSACAAAAIAEVDPSGRHSWG